MAAGKMIGWELLEASAGRPGLPSCLRENRACAALRQRCGALAAGLDEPVQLASSGPLQGAADPQGERTPRWLPLIMTTVSLLVSSADVHLRSAGFVIPAFCTAETGLHGRGGR
jgi:hypothetical protein